jgi:hypothetical protein
MGTEWTRLQSIALGEDHQNFKDTCEAVLQLYATAAQEVRHLLNQRQLQVVEHACEIAGHPLVD